MRRNPNARGYTLIEAAVVLGIVAVVTAAAYASLSAMRPRASLAGTASEITGLLYNARQNSLATGNHTVVMVFPRQANGDGGVGRVVAYEDPTLRFFSAASAVNFGNWTGSRNPQVQGANLIGSVDLPPGVVIGLGSAGAPALPAPYDAVTASECNFCSTSGDGRGAVVFDSRGAARFFSSTGTTLSLTAGTLAVTGYPTIQGYQMFLITPTTGAVRPYDRG
jgi:prepilin-type N-terminal cleavage/methylation domain-containing protein